MRLLMVLFLAITLSILPSAAFCRDVNKYTVEYNATELEKVGKEIYGFVAGLEKLENNWPVRRHITTSIFDIIDKRHCDETLWIINRGIIVNVDKDGIITHLLITIFVMNSLEFIDTVILKYDIQAVKKGDPIKIKRERQQV